MIQLSNFIVWDFDLYSSSNIYRLSMVPFRALSKFLTLLKVFTPLLLISVFCRALHAFTNTKVER